MKKQFFTFLMMIALVIVAGKAMAQGSTALLPWIGSTHTYTFSATNGDGYVFTVSDSPTATTTATDLSAIYSFNGSSTGTVGTPDAGEASVTIDWKSGDNATSYYLWITVTGTGAGACSNFRYVVITPQNKYIVNFGVLALEASGTDHTTLAALNGLTTSDVDITANCFTAPNQYIATSIPNLDATDLTATNGQVYVYYKVTRTPNTNSPANNTWSYNATATAGPTGWQYYVDGTGWTGTATGRVDVPSTTNVLYVRAVTSMPTADLAITYDISGGATPDHPSDTNTAGGTVKQEDYLTTDNDVAITVKAIPTIGDFSFE